MHKNNNMSVHELIDEFLRLKRDVKTLTTGAITTANIPLFIDEGALTIPQASGISDGYLSTADFTTFSNSALWEAETVLTLPTVKPIDDNQHVYAKKGLIIDGGNTVYEKTISGIMRAHINICGGTFQSVAIGSRGLANQIAGGLWVPSGIGETVSIGEFAGQVITTGINNVFIGKGAGSSVTTGSNNILIGRNVTGSAAATNTLQIGTIIYGSGSAITDTSISIGSSTVVSNLILSLVSTTKAFASPRMTTAQRNAIATPTAGMQVYDTTTNKMSVHDGTSWRYLQYEP